MVILKRPLPLLAIALIVTASGCHGKTRSNGGAKAVITVANHAITVDEFASALKRSTAQDPSSLSAEEIKTLKSELVNQLVEETLILDEAQKYGVTATDKELIAEIESTRKASGEKSIDGEIKEKYGSVDEWKQDVRKRLIIKKTIDRALAGDSGVTEAEANRYFREHKGEFKNGERVRARMIVLSTEDGARELRKKLTPENFSGYARQKSISPERERGGDLGFFGRGDMPKEFEDAVFRLKPREISPVVKTEYGYHIFMLEERTVPAKPGFNSVRDDIMKNLRQEKLDAAFARWVTGLKSNSRIEIKEELL